MLQMSSSPTTTGTVSCIVALLRSASSNDRSCALADRTNVVLLFLGSNIIPILLFTSDFFLSMSEFLRCTQVRSEERIVLILTPF